MSRVQRWLTTPWVPPAALAAVLGIDAALEARKWPVPVVGALDDSAHVATSGILLAAFLPRSAAALGPWALAGSVLIDLDHLPLYARGALVVGEGQRPVTHSLATAAALGLSALALPGLRTRLCGLGLGVLLHFARDLGTGPGLPLLWPATTTAVRLPYFGYLAPLTAVTAGAAVRHLTVRRPRRRRRDLGLADR